MYAALSLIVLSLACCSALARHRYSRAARARGEQLRGFLYIGEVALLGLAVAVVVVGLADDRNARAEGLALFGLFVYTIYMLAAFAIVRLTGRR